MCALLLIEHTRNATATRSQSADQPKRTTLLSPSSQGVCPAGDLSPPPSGEQLKHALAARSYRQEVIIFTSSQALAAVLTLDNLVALGLEHYLLIAPAQAACVVYRRLRPTCACAWSTFSIPRPRDASPHGVQQMRLTHARQVGSGRDRGGCYLLTTMQIQNG